MKPETTARFKALFEAEMKKLTAQSFTENTGLIVNQDDLADEADITSSELSSSMMMRLKTREALYLKKVEQSLKRLAEGTFGTCTSCESEIEMRRLEARPTTTLCLDCKEEQERREAIHIDGRRHKSLGQRLRLA